MRVAGNFSSTSMVNAERMTKLFLPLEIKAFAVGAAALSMLGVGFAQTLGGDEDPLRLEPKRLPVREEPLDVPEVIEIPQERTFRDDRAVDPPALVHLASYYGRDDAMRGWGILTDDFPDLLRDHEPILRDIDLGARGRFVRLLAGPLPSEAEADDLCRALEGAGAYCMPANAAGELMPHR